MEGSVDSGQDNVGSDHLGKLHQSYWGDRFGRGYVAEQGSRGNDAGRAALKRRWSQAVSGSGFTVTPPATAGLSLQGQQFVVEHEQMPRCIFRCSATNCCISAGKYTLIGGVVPDVELISCGLQHAQLLQLAFGALGLNQTPFSEGTHATLGYVREAPAAAVMGARQDPRRGY